MKILIVDDDAICRKTLGMILKKSGYEILEAKNAGEALELLKSDEPIILVITDIVMPEMDGLGFLAEVRSSPSLGDLPIMILTSLDPKTWLSAAECFKIAGHLPKPINGVLLRDRVDGVLGSRKLPLSDTTGILRRLNLKKEEYTELVEDFLLSLKDELRSIEDLPEELPTEQMRCAYHGLAGSARSLGALRLSSALLRQSDACKASDRRAITEIGAELRRETRLVEDTLVTIRAAK